MIKNKRIYENYFNPASEPIVIISPNPTLDTIYYNANYSFSNKTFFDEASLHPGGSGINVARGLQYMGIPYIVFIILGGHSGKLVKTLLNNEKISFVAVEGHGDTRITSIEYNIDNNGNIIQIENKRFKQLFEMGVSHIWFGIETGSEKIAKK